MKLSDEELESLKSGSLSATAQIIEYLEEQKKSNKKDKWKSYLFGALTFALGALFNKIFDTYWDYILNFLKNIFA